MWRTCDEAIYIYIYIFIERERDKIDKKIIF